MNKRLIVVGLIVGLITLWTMVLPSVQDAEQTKRQTNSIPNFSPTGYQGLFRLTGATASRPVDRWRHSVMVLSADDPKTLWFIEPGHRLFAEETGYVGAHLKTLVKSGYHLVFVLNGESVQGAFAEDGLMDQIDALNRWFEMDLIVETDDLMHHHTLWTQSRFADRTVQRLVYISPQEAYAGWFKGKEPHPPTMVYFPGDLNGGEGETLLSLKEQAGDALAIRMERGKGSVTVFPNAYLFQNAQLDRGDNAALAVALQELTPAGPLLFEEYSQGFTEKRDFITYLASGKGIAFLISSMLMLFVFCLWIANRPLGKRTVVAGSLANYFTQETFLTAIGTHYLETRRWDQLYGKLLEQLDELLTSKYSYLTQPERLQMLAQSPFYDVSLSELEAIYQRTPIGTEAAFIQRSRRLLEVLRKVRRHDFRQSKFRGVDPTFSNRR